MLLLGVLLGGSAPAQVKISEFLANNVSVNPDNWDFEDFSDWIELHNEGSTSANIGGYYLTGDLKQPKKWQFPADASIPANGYLLVWADDHDGKPGQKEVREWYPWNEEYSLKRYHAVFKLGQSGEQVGLYNASGAIVDSVTFPQQFPDVSMGRKEDGSWAFFDEPTPEAANTTTAKPLGTAEVSGDVTFSVEGGRYTSSQTVTLTAADGSDIYYTTDGSIPHSSGKKYTSKISIVNNVVIRARTFSASKFAGKVSTNTYFINDEARKVMVVSLSTDPDFLSDKTYGIWANNMKGREIPASLEFFTPDGKRVVRCNAGIRNGTLTSFGEKQHPLQVALRKRYGDESVNYQFFNKPITKFDRFRLRQGGDVWAENFIGDALLDPINQYQTAIGYQAFRPTVVYVNGEYYGLMDLREQFKESFFAENYAVDGTKRDDVRSILLPASGGGGMGASYVEGWEILAGTWDAYRSLLASVKSGTVDAAKYSQIKQQVDIASMTDFFCLIHFGDAVSWGHNQELWRVPGGKWQWLVTDFDRAWTYSGSMGSVTHNLFSSGAGTSKGLVPGDTLFSKLIGNSEFKNYFVQRYAAHLNATFKPERLTAIVDSISGLIVDEMDDHAAKWGSQGGIKSTAAWKTDVGNVKKFMAERSTNVWKHLAAAPINVSESKAELTIKVTPANAQADIFINDVRMSQGLSAISMFKGIPFQVKAVGKPGWVVEGWDADNTSDSITVTLDGNRTVTVRFVASASVPSRTVLPGTEFGCRYRVVSENGNIVLHVSMSSPVNDHLRVSVFDMHGRKVATVPDAEIAQSSHRTITLPLGTLSSGVYFSRIQTDTFNQVQRIGLPSK